MVAHARKVAHAAARTVGAFRQRPEVSVMPAAGGAAARVEAGLEVRGVGKGTATLLGMAGEWLEALGPADLYLTTWTNTGAAIGMSIVPWLAGHGASVRSARIALRSGVSALAPRAVAELQALAPGALVEADSHAEIVALVGDGWSRACLSHTGVHSVGCFDAFATTADAELVAGLVEWFRELRPAGGVVAPAQRTLEDLIGGLACAK